MSEIDNNYKIGQILTEPLRRAIGYLVRSKARNPELFRCLVTIIRQCHSPVEGPYGNETVIATAIAGIAHYGNLKLGAMGTVSQLLVDTFESLGQKRFERLLRRSRRPEAQTIRLALCDALAKIGEPEAVERLEDTSDEPNALVQERMWKAANRIRTRWGSDYFDDDDDDEYDDDDDGFVVCSEEAQDTWENEESHARLYAKYVREEDEATREAVAQEARRVEERFAREKRRAHEVAAARARPPPQRGAKKPKVFLRIGGGRVKKNLLYKKPPPPLPPSLLAPIFRRNKKAAAGAPAVAAASPLSKVHTCAVKTCRNPVAPHSLHCANHCKRKRKYMGEAQQDALRKNMAASVRRVAKLREKSKLFVEQFTLREIVRARDPPAGGLGCCVFCDAPRRRKHVMTCKEHGRLAQLRTLLGSMSEADVEKKIRAEDTRIASMRTTLANVRTVRRLTRVEEYRNRARAAAREKSVWKECAECAHRWRPPRQGGGECPECGASVVSRMVAFHR